MRIILMILMVGFVASASAEEIPGSRLGYRIILIDEVHTPDRPFQINIPPENKEGIRTLESFLRNSKPGEKQPYIGLAMGPVIPTTPTKRHPWQFKFDEGKVTFQEIAIELCDGSLEYVEEHLREYMFVIKSYCPWSTSYWVQSVRPVLYPRKNQSGAMH